MYSRAGPQCDFIKIKKEPHYTKRPQQHLELHYYVIHKNRLLLVLTSPTSRASSVKVAIVKTTPKRPSRARVIVCASLATKTAAFDASLSILHSIPEWYFPYQ